LPGPNLIFRVAVPVEEPTCAVPSAVCPLEEFQKVTVPADTGFPPLVTVAIKLPVWPTLALDGCTLKFTFGTLSLAPMTMMGLDTPRTDADVESVTLMVRIPRVCKITLLKLDEPLVRLEGTGKDAKPSLL
jgi:hypothetical protein